MSMTWIKGKEVHAESDAHREYRPLTEIQSLTFHNIVKTIGSFLNARLRGRVILGVYGFPIKLVHGFALDSSQKEDIVNRVNYALHHRFSPSVPEELVNVHFEPVYQEQLKEDKTVALPLTDVYVIEIHVSL